jgi:hypothetical protein
MNLVVLKLLLRKAILSLAVMLALAHLSPWLYFVLGLVVAVAIIPILWPKFRARGQRAHQYWPVFLLSVLTWPDSVLTQTLRARRAIRAGG